MVDTMRKIFLITAAAMLAGALLVAGVALAADFFDLTITGKLVKEADTYYIQGSVPREVFRVLNPNSKTLDTYLDDQAVEIQAESLVGDNVYIFSINGKPYKGGKD